MKTLKTVVLAVFAIGLLTGISNIKEVVETNDTTNQEINQPNEKLIALKGVTPRIKPTPSKS